MLTTGQASISAPTQAFASAGSDFTATQPGRAANLAGTLDLFRPYDFFMGQGSNFGGFQAGYNTVFNSGLLVGIEADVSFPGYMSGTSGLATASIAAATYSDQMDMSGSVRARIGYAFDRWLYYWTAGYAWTQDNLTRTQLSDNPAGATGGTVESKFPARSGWTVGAGIEAPLVPRWTTRLEYLYSDFGTASVTFPLAGQRFDSNLSVQEVRVGLNYKLGDSGSNANSFLTATAPPDARIGPFTAKRLLPASTRRRFTCLIAAPTASTRTQAARHGTPRFMPG